MEELYAGILKVTLFLIGTIGLLAILRKHRFRFALSGEKRENGSIKKLDTVHLGYRKFVSVLEIKDRVLIVGISDKEISLLAQWRKDDKE